MSHTPYQMRRMPWGQEWRVQSARYVQELPTIFKKDLGMKDSCWGVDHFVGYGVSEYGSVKGRAMMREILARGPITCSFAADDAFMFRYAENANKHEGVYVDRTKKSDEGWTMTSRWSDGVTESGLKYWIVRNSGARTGARAAGSTFCAARIRCGSIRCGWAVPASRPHAGIRISWRRLHGGRRVLFGGGERRSSDMSWMSWLVRPNGRPPRWRRTHEIKPD